ncbi:MAG: response regulator transcription factor [Chloroflexi bacterium]|nr:response regulator transcription factor [Chloroflexota bacterium]
MLSRQRVSRSARPRPKPADRHPEIHLQQSNFAASPVNGHRSTIRVLVALLDNPTASRVRRDLSNAPEVHLLERGDGEDSPQVVIVDYRRETGLTAVHGGREARPVALGPGCDDAAVLDALQYGAWALLPEDPSPSELLAVVRKVAAGECPILADLSRRPEVAGQALTRLRMIASRPGNPLSAREAAILAHVARGAKNGVIGAILGVREQTVKNYLSGILKKTRTGNRAEAAAVALRNGWLDT